MQIAERALNPVKCMPQIFRQGFSGCFNGIFGFPCRPEESL
jgi:hypothetical protein